MTLSCVLSYQLDPKAILLRAEWHTTIRPGQRVRADLAEELGPELTESLNAELAMNPPLGERIMFKTFLFRTCKLLS